MRQHPRQLAFDWGEAGEARPDPGEGSPPAPAPDRAGALARDIMEEVVVGANLRRALKRVQANRGSPGVDGMTVRSLSGYLRQEWPRLRAALLTGSYRPQPVKRVDIPKPDGGVRQLGIPTVVDRFIQQAVLQVLDPWYDPTFSPHSYGFRRGKSAHQALDQAKAQVEAGYGWVVDLDLEKCFDRVNHDLVMGRLAKRIGDKRVLRLNRRYLEAGVLLNGVVVERWEGTPQGGPLSPLLANVLLDDLDRELQCRGHRFVRYADDCNSYVRSQRGGGTGESVHHPVPGTAAAAEGERGQECRGAAQGADVPGATRAEWSRDPVGHRSGEPEAGEGHHPAAYPADRGVSLGQVLEELRTFTNGWVGYFWHARTLSVFQELDQWLRRRLRCYQWKQWKGPRTRARELEKAGVAPRLAWGTACDGPGLWRAAGSPALTQALPNRQLAALGFASLYERYQALASA